jgi:hypothetical protein
LLQSACQTENGDQARRPLAARVDLDGSLSADAARFDSMTVQILRDRVVLFNDLVPTGWSTVRIRASHLS